MLQEESIHDGMQSAATEPNGPGIWQQLEAEAADVLYGLWLDGWFVGAQTARSLTLVRCSPVWPTGSPRTVSDPAVPPLDQRPRE
jgi:phage tail sheath protein FI